MLVWSSCILTLLVTTFLHSYFLSEAICILCFPLKDKLRPYLLPTPSPTFRRSYDSDIQTACFPDPNTEQQLGPLISSFLYNVTWNPDVRPDPFYGTTPVIYKFVDGWFSPSITNAFQIASMEGRLPSKQWVDAPTVFQRESGTAVFLADMYPVWNDARFPRTPEHTYYFQRNKTVGGRMIELTLNPTKLDLSDPLWVGWTTTGFRCGSRRDHSIDSNEKDVPFAQVDTSIVGVALLAHTRAGNPYAMGWTADFSSLWLQSRDRVWTIPVDQTKDIVQLPIVSDPKNQLFLIHARRPDGTMQQGTFCISEME